MNFFYSFIQTILHSIWQAALLLCVYLLVNTIVRNYHPLQKRNFLYLLLLSQFFISIVTFLSFFIGFSFTIGFSIPFQTSHVTFISNYYGIIFTFYTGIVIAKLIQITTQWSDFRNNYTQQIIQPSATLKIFTQLHANHFSIKKNITLWFSNSIKTPVTFGFFKPVILLPISLINNISTEQAELIILHELVHIKCRDYLYNWFLLLMEVIYFFNPFIKILTNNLRLEREKNCDVQVINHQYGALKYAEALYKIANSNIILKGFQLGAFKNNSQLYKRIKYFSDDKNLDYSKSGNLFFIPVLTSVICFIWFLMVPNKSSFKIPVSHFSVNFTKPFSEKKSFITATIPSSKKITSNKFNENLSAKINTQTLLNTVVNNINEVRLIDDNNLITPVVFEEYIDSAKEVIYNVETQHKKVTQSYKLYLKNGICVFEPQWMIVETNDSTAKKINLDSSFLNNFREIQ